MNVKEIIGDYLEHNGYDGLFNGWTDCACRVSDLIPCDDFCLDCDAGYLQPSDDGTQEFEIGSSKPKEAKS